MEKKINEGIMIFKDTFEYLIDGDLDEMQFCELMRLIYQARFGNGVELDDIKDKFVKSIWRTLRHSVARSTTNAKQYAKKLAKKEVVTNDNTPNDISNQTTKDNGSESLKLINNGNREIPAEFAIEEPVKTDVRLDNILTIPLNKPSLFNDYLTKLIHLHKKDTIGSITTYEEIEKEEVLDGMRNILLSSGYAADSVDNTIEECVTLTIAA